MKMIRTLATASLGLTLALAVGTSALAQGKGLDEPFRDGYKKEIGRAHV